MSKRYARTIEEVQNWIDRGDGQGEGPDYRPFLYVRDVPSEGRSAIDRGLKSGRSHHYLSDVEYGYFLLAEYAKHVRSIREQYALLPLAETQEIARLLGIDHPLYRPSRVPRVMTSDLVLTMQPNVSPAYFVISCKVSSDLDPANPKAHRTLELLRLEKIYWSRRPVRWILGTDTALPKNKIFNLDLFRQTMQAYELDRLNELLPTFVSLTERIWSADRTMNDLLFELSRRLRLNVIETFTLLGRAVWLRRLPVDLDATTLGHEKPIPLASTPSSSTLEDGL